MLHGRQTLPAVALPDTAAIGAPGRVHALGRFESRDVEGALRDALPPPLGDALRSGFEWYACRGAFFHNDAHYGGVLFGAWCVAGPPRDIVFSRAGLRLSVAPGHWAVFDPFEPHAVLDPDAATYRREDYDGAPASLFIGFELELTDAVRRELGIGEPTAGAVVLSSDAPIQAETGALQ